MHTCSLNSMRTVWDRLAEPRDLRPPNTTSNTLHGDNGSAESEWYARSVTESGRDSYKTSYAIMKVYTSTYMMYLFPLFCN